jgi:mono/diheme cytochrome c family protein
MAGDRSLICRGALPVPWLAVFGYTIVALSSMPSPCSAQPRALSMASARDIAGGKEIYEAQCAVCHGEGGAGGTGPDLRRSTLFHAKDDQALLNVIREGIPGTPLPFAFLFLSDSMIWQTAAYVSARLAA